MYSMNYDYLRPKKAVWVKRMYDTPFPVKESPAVWRGRNATILPLRDLHEPNVLFGRGGVVDENGQYVELSGIPERIQKGYAFENPEFKDEKVVYCGYLVHHWGHFLIEAITRLWFVLEKEENVDKYVFFLDDQEDRTIKGNFREFLELLNIWEKVEFVNKPTTYREVVVPEQGFCLMRYYSPKFLDMIEYLVSNVKVDPAWKPVDKIFFTRSNFAKGNNYDFGLEVLDNYYRKNGYFILAPETITLSEMIYLVRNASEFATISGSVHHNMLFAPMGSKLAIIERLTITDDCMVSINKAKEFDVTCIDGNFNLYTVSTCGPFITGYNGLMERYTQDNGMAEPDEYFMSKEYRDKCFKGYMRSYQSNYGYRWFMLPWYAEISDSLIEGYEENYPFFQEYLDGNRPFLREHYFQLHYIKQMIKRLLRINRNQN